MPDFWLSGVKERSGRRRRIASRPDGSASGRLSSTQEGNERQAQQSSRRLAERGQDPRVRLPHLLAVALAECIESRLGDLSTFGGKLSGSVAKIFLTPPDAGPAVPVGRLIAGGPAPCGIPWALVTASCSSPPLDRAMDGPSSPTRRAPRESADSGSRQGPPPSPWIREGPARSRPRAAAGPPLATAGKAPPP